MELFGKQSESMNRSAEKTRNLRLGAAGVLILLILAGVFFAWHFGGQPVTAPEPKAAVEQVRDSTVELISANGLVVLQKPGWTEWRAVRAGTRLTEGDSIRTDSAGSANIVYPDGTALFIQANTVFTVQNIENGKEAVSTAPIQAASENPVLTPGPKPEDNTLVGTPAAEKAGEELPAIELQRIIPFGKTLELVGKVEAGSRLVVNGEPVDVSGDGSFKHFTNPFLVSAGKIRLVLKATNLAGRSRILATSYDFGPHGGSN
jgi:hypothetical protein